MRVGLGYDIHRLVAGRPLVLGGIRIPFENGLLGHSDADVVLHALMDALLGAAHLGDIGRHFPPSDERFRDASSIRLLVTVRDLVRGEGLRLVNADIVVIAEAPQIGPHVSAMEDAIATALQAPPGAVSVKATTNEGMGPEGRGESISAHAVALLERTT